MMNRDELKALAQRVMALAGPDREVFCAAYKACFPPVEAGTLDAIDAWDDGYDRFCGMLDAGAFLSAAQQIVPAGLDWNVGFEASTVPPGTAWVEFWTPRRAADPALALLAVALLARAAKVPA